MLGPTPKPTRLCDQTGKADRNIQRLTPSLQRDDHPAAFDFQGAVILIIETLSPSVKLPRSRVCLSSDRFVRASLEVGTPLEGCRHGKAKCLARLPQLTPARKRGARPAIGRTSGG